MDYILNRKSFGFWEIT